MDHVQVLICKAGRSFASHDSNRRTCRQTPLVREAINKEAFRVMLLIQLRGREEAEGLQQSSCRSKSHGVWRGYRNSLSNFKDVLARNLLEEDMKPLTSFAKQVWGNVD